MTSNKARFEQDLTLLVKQLTDGMDKTEAQQLNKLKDDLIKLQKANIVKINHSVMELVCAKQLIMKGYNVEIEYVLNELLTCDLYCVKGYGNLIVEIETGYIPPENALSPLTYTYARLASKIIRYSKFAGRFALGVPPHYVLPLPQTLALPPRNRKELDIQRIKNLCDLYYSNPPVTEEDIRNARIQGIFVIDVDRLNTLEIDPEAYMKRAIKKGLVFTPQDEVILQRLKALAPPISAEKLDKWAK